MVLKRTAVAILIGVVGVVSFTFASAWAGPTATPPGDNVPAPVNVGTDAQVKNAGLGVNSIAVFGNEILSGVGRYFNFGSTAGSGGYGIRDNAGILEFKNSGGSWQSIQNVIYTLVGSTSPWTASGNNIYNSNTGSVGIGTASPGQKLDVAGNIRASGETIGTLASGYGQFRAIAGNYGFMVRNDAANTYFLLTAAGDQYGIWNGLRPFAVNNATGNVTFGTGVTFNNNITVGSATLATNGDLYMPWKGQWLSTALNNKIDFNTWGPGSTYYGTNGDIYLVWRGQWLSTVLSQIHGVTFGGQFWSGAYGCPWGSVMAAWSSEGYGMLCQYLY